MVYATCLKGEYDFALIWLPGNADRFRNKLSPDVFERPIIFAAVREQRGVKLAAQQGPGTYFVVDYIRRPTENWARDWNKLAL